MGEPMELSIQVRFEGGEAFPSSFIAQSMNVVEDEVFRLEYDELEEIFDVLKDAPEGAKEACQERIQRHKGSSLLLGKASGSPFVLTGVPTALAYWVVENVIGESVKDADKKSELHEKLKALLLKRSPTRNKELSYRINQRLFRPNSDTPVSAEAQLAENDPNLLEVKLRLNRWEGVPPRQTQWAQ
ncbi:MAG: hypothetical protein OEV35_08955, partial [Gallionellaceae bacterium]|nr:hypothetical protein [Gallionellaceae bacterium]